jgi:uncharacterized protein (TIGR01777 family)
MNIVVTGATGFVGRHLLPKLSAQGHAITTVGRRPVEGLHFVPWQSPGPLPASVFDNCDAVVHLAGETVAQRWTADAKRRIRASRVDGTRSIVNAMQQARTKPAVLVSASAVGIYGDGADEILTESSPPGAGFLAGVTAAWEEAARTAGSFGARVVLLRFGIVLGRDGGAFPRLVTPFRFGAGGTLASGKQWMPWVHIDDAIAMLLFALHGFVNNGPLNVTAPHPVTNAEFTRLLAAALHRPALITVPAFALKLVLGEMSEAVLGSVRAIPAAAQRAGFRFTYSDAAAALTALTRQ